MSPPDVTSSAITVAGESFVDWFNANLGLRGDFLRHIEEAPFRAVFDHVAELWAPSLTLAQFCAFFAVFYNETGGTLRPIAEMGGPRYCFETNGGKKASYNRHPNRLAGDQLLTACAISTPEDVAAWNGSHWPGGVPAVLVAAQECDFYKFRGHGFIQTTWRTTYLLQVDPLLDAAGFASSDQLSTAELDEAVLTTPSVSLGMVRAFFSQPALAAAFMLVDHEPPIWAPTGTRVSGSPAYGAGVFTRRCEAIYSGMIAAGYEVGGGGPAQVGSPS